jgi:hypothetical protein
MSYVPCPSLHTYNSICRVYRSYRIEYIRVEDRAESREQRAESREQRAERAEQRAESRAESREQRAESREQRYMSTSIFMFYCGMGRYGWYWYSGIAV